MVVCQGASHEIRHAQASQEKSDWVALLSTASTDLIHVVSETAGMRSSGPVSLIGLFWGSICSDSCLWLTLKSSGDNCQINEVYLKGKVVMLFYHFTAPELKEASWLAIIAAEIILNHRHAYSGRSLKRLSNKSSLFKGRRTGTRKRNESFPTPGASRQHTKHQTWAAQSLSRLLQGSVNQINDQCITKTYRTNIKRCSTPLLDAYVEP